MRSTVPGSRLSDEALLRGFERASLAPGDFHHVEHVRVAWLYLQRYEPARALDRFATRVQRLATAHGARERYHETITWAYLLLIRERLEIGESWSDFECRAADLLDWQAPILDRYYSSELLRSDRARDRFVLPDRIQGD